MHNNVLTQYAIFVITCNDVNTYLYVFAHQITKKVPVICGNSFTLSERICLTKRSPPPRKVDEAMVRAGWGRFWSLTAKGSEAKLGIIQRMGI